MTLLEVCNQLLNNADLMLSVDGENGVITLEFYPAAFDGVVTFTCQEYSRLHFRKHPDDATGIFVGETKVSIVTDLTEIRRLYSEDGWQNCDKYNYNSVALIEIEGGAMLSIVCEKFSWMKGQSIAQVEL